MIEVSTLCCKKGDINVETDENDPAQRKLLAEYIVAILAKGAFVSVKMPDGKDVRISGYDAEKNEWLLSSKPKKKKSSRKPASGSKVTVVAPIAGG